MHIVSSFHTGCLEYIKDLSNVECNVLPFGESG
jgi:hypothetical protein